MIAPPLAPLSVADDRIVGLDLWRAFLMSAGLLVHGGIWLDTRPLFTWIAYLSSGTRMGVFFAIAGVLAARGLRGRSVRRWAERRLSRLVPPTIFGLLILCPAIAVLHVFRSGDVGDFVVQATRLHHVWFLVALCLYTGATAVFWPIWTRFGLTPRTPVPALILTTAFAGVAIAWCVQLAVPVEPGGRIGVVWEERRMLIYLPVFVMGLALGRRDNATWQAVGGSILPLVLLLLVFGWRIVVNPWIDGAAAGRTVEVIDDILRMAVSPPAAAILVLRSAAAIRQVPAWLDRAAAAALTLYLLHVPLIILAHLISAPFGLDPHLRFGFAVVSAGLGAYHVHHRIIARTPILAWVTNGVPLPRRGAAGAVAT